MRNFTEVKLMRTFNPLIALWMALLLVGTAVLVISLTLVIGPENGGSIFRLLGRFHVLVLHFPIVLLLLAPSFDFLSRKPRYKVLDKSADILWLLACMSTVITALLGMALAATEGFNEGFISFHLSAGTSVAILALFCFGLRATWLDFKSVLLGRCYALLSVILIFMMLVTAHAGGNLVHGKGYITEFIPKAFQLTSLAKKTVALASVGIDDGISLTVIPLTQGVNISGDLPSITKYDNSEGINNDITQFDLDTELDLNLSSEYPDANNTKFTRSNSKNSVSISQSTLTGQWHVENKITYNVTKFAKRSRVMMKKYCFQCHNKQFQAGGIRLDTLPYKPLTAKDKSIWALSKTVIEQGGMHASKGTRLSPKEQGKLLSWLPNIKRMN